MLFISSLEEQKENGDNKDLEVGERELFRETLTVNVFGDPVLSQVG